MAARLQKIVLILLSVLAVVSGRNSRELLHVCRENKESSQFVGKKVKM